MSTRCSFCSGRAVCRVRKKRLCLSCLKRACKMYGVPVPSRFKENQREQQTCPHCRNKFTPYEMAHHLEWHVKQLPSGFRRFLTQRGYLPESLRPDFLMELWKNKAVREEFSKWERGGSLIDAPSLFNPNRRRKTRGNLAGRYYIEQLQDGAFYIVERRGRTITRLVSGPFPSFDVAVSYVQHVRRFKHNPRRDEIFFGRAPELPYLRQIGRHRGFYKHKFQRWPTVNYNVKRNEVVLR
jgi:hypothetical protein